MHKQAEQQPLGVHRDVVSGFGRRNRGLAPAGLFGRVAAAGAAAFPRKSLRDFTVVFTLCVSMIAAVGLGSRRARRLRPSQHRREAHGDLGRIRFPA